MDVHYYCVALPQRAENVAKIRETLPSLTMIEACNGALFTKEFIDKLKMDGFLPSDGIDKHVIGRNISVGQVGCFMSHQRVLLAILQQEEPYAVVVEDDVELCPGFIENVKNVIHSMEQKQTDFDLVRLHVVDDQKSFLPAELKGVMPVPNGFWGTVAYLVKKKNVATILETLFPMNSTIDIQLSYSKLSQYVVVGIPFIKEQNIPSFLNTEAKRYINE